MALPYTSSETVVLGESDYNLKPLVHAVTQAVRGKAYPEVKVPADHALLHTLSLQCSFRPLADHHDDKEAMDNLLAAVMDSTDALVPLTLLPPTPDVLGIPVRPFNALKKVPTIKKDRGPALTLPSNAKVATPLLKLPRVLRGGAKPFLVSTTAWDSDNWLHAAMAINPALPPTRARAYKDDIERIHLRTGVEAVWVPDEEDTPEFRLIVTVDAYLNTTTFDQPMPEISDDLFRMILASLIRPELPAQKEKGGALRELYESLRPAANLAADFDINLLQPKGLAAKLYPFQKRTVGLLLRNEGVATNGQPERDEPTDQWTNLDLDSFGHFAFSHLTGELRRLSDHKGKGRSDAAERLPTFFSTKEVRGTMLCEEMGLGKTVEAIALMLLNTHPLLVPRPYLGTAQKEAYEVDLANPPDQPDVQEWLAKQHNSFKDAVTWSEESELNVAEVSTTLVVTPLPLLKQWVTEMATHAPSLRVCIYPGWQGLIQQVRDNRKASVKEHAKREARDRKRKNTQIRNQARAKYARGDAGKIAVESESEDDDDDVPSTDEDSLESLLKATQRMWLDYVRTHDVVITTYQVLGDDLKVAHPAPKRARRSTAKYNLEERPRSPLVMVEWWRVIMDEVQLQGDQSDAAQMVSLIPRKYSLAMSGTPARHDVHDMIGSLRFLRVPDIGRVFWHRLLQPANRTALHSLFQSLAVRTTKTQVAHEFNIPGQTRFVIPIELGQIEQHYYQDTLERQRQRLRNYTFDNLDLVEFKRALLHLRQICTHIQVGGLNSRADRAERIHLGQQLVTMEEALDKMRTDHEATLNDAVKGHMRLLLRKESLAVLDATVQNRHMGALQVYQQVRDLGQPLLDAARAQLQNLTADREGSVDVVLDRTAPKEERDRVRQILNSTSLVREVLMLMHEAWFYEGDARHMLGQEEEATLGYPQADAIREELLARPLRQANSAISRMTKSFKDEPVIKDIADLLTSARLRGNMDTKEINSLLRILNDNATLVTSWRDKVVELLQQPVEAQTMDVDDAPAEDYYSGSLKTQAELEAFLDAYAAVISDRKEMLLEERTLIGEMERRQTKKRTTRRAQQAAADAIQIPEDDDEVKELIADLSRERQAFRERRTEEKCTRPLKALLIEITLRGSGDEQLTTTLRAYINTQSQHVDDLYKELDTFRATANKRLVYYRVLQEISDSVSPPEFDDRAKELAQLEVEITAIEAKTANIYRTLKFVSHLQGDKDRDVREECPICFGTSDDTHTVFLDCGHMICVSCFRELRKAQTGDRCPTCKSPIENNKRYAKVPLKTMANTATVEEVVENEPVDAPEDSTAVQRRGEWARLRMLDQHRRDTIDTMDVMGNYGAKITFLLKHLQWFRLTRPQVRHVVFSNWADSLSIVEAALTANNIKFVSFDRNTKRNDVVQQFHADPSINVFLLHAERESAGLTLTSCGVVHLLEPVLHHSYELQAIGRVDRLGQKKETEVYCYATLETVEARILCQAVPKGTSIYLNDTDESDRAIEDMPNVASAARGGGDINIADPNGNAELLSLIM